MPEGESRMQRSSLGLGRGPAMRNCSDTSRGATQTKGMGIRSIGETVESSSARDPAGIMGHSSWIPNILSCREEEWGNPARDSNGASVKIRSGLPVVRKACRQEVGS